MIFRSHRRARRVTAVDDAVEPVVGQVAAELADVVYVIRELPDRAFEYVSPSVEKLTGFTPAEHYADPGLVVSMIDPQDQGRQIWVHHRARTCSALTVLQRCTAPRATSPRKCSPNSSRRPRLDD